MGFYVFSCDGFSYLIQAGSRRDAERKFNEVWNDGRQINISVRNEYGPGDFVCEEPLMLTCL